MDNRLHVKKDGSVIYDICFEDDFGRFASELEALSYSPDIKIAIISDSNVAPLHLDSLINSISSKYPNVYSFIFEAGEANKTLDTVEDVYEFLITNKFERKDLLIALGGGVVGDLTGFTAATYLRGVDFIQVPTSLIAMSDSSVGGKTGVDFRAFKNMVGAFYMPRLVYMNISVLKTLPSRQLSSGMGEVIKHGYIKDAALLGRLAAGRDNIFACESIFMKDIVYTNCDIKRAVVENDPTEKGERALLNFGHSIGHAIEKLMNFELFHGECVALGMCAAAYISMKRGQISQAEYESVIEMCKLYNLPTTIENPGFNAIKVAETMKSDKKMEAGKIKFILLESVGNAIIDKTVSDEEIIDAVNTLLR